MKKFYGLGTFTLSDLLSTEYCYFLIKKGEELGFTPAMINNRGVREFNQMRNNESVIFEDPVFAERLWGIVKEHIPIKAENMTAYGIDHLFRMYKYYPGQYFKQHVDGATKKPNGDRSLYTFIMYLNEDYEGGETSFDFAKIKGKRGMGLIFPHKLLHVGEEVTSGIKYAIRTDIMYTKNEI